MDYRKYGNTYLVCMEVGEEMVVASVRLALGVV